MDSFDGDRRRDPRSPLPPAERRFARDPEPLEQRLDRWVSTGRQLVEGVAGGRPGTRPSGRRSEGRPGARGGFDGLGRWVENRLDWLLDDGEDWPEPWQQSERRRAEPPPPAGAGPLREPDRGGERNQRPRRPLQAISRRGGQPAERGAPAAEARMARPVAERDAGSARSRVTPAEDASPANGWSDATADWPDDEAFSVPRWQRPAAPVRRPDPLQTELEQRGQDQGEGSATPPGQSSRPLPRSSRRR